MRGEEKSTVEPNPLTKVSYASDPFSFAKMSPCNNCPGPTYLKHINVKKKNNKVEQI